MPSRSPSAAAPARTAGASSARDDRDHAARRHVAPLERGRQSLLRLQVHAAVAERRVGVGHRVQASAGAAHAADDAGEVTHVPVRRRAVVRRRRADSRAAGRRRGCPPHRWRVARFATSVDRTLERRGDVEQAGERGRGPRPGVGDRRKRAAGELLDRLAQPARRSCPRGPSPRSAGAPGDSRAGRFRRAGGVPASRAPETTLPAASATASWSTGSPHVLRDPGRAQRERAAERAAQVVALGQFAGVARQQLPCPRKQRHSRGLSRHQPNIWTRRAGGRSALEPMNGRLAAEDGRDQVPRDRRDRSLATVAPQTVGRFRLIE